MEYVRKLACNANSEEGLCGWKLRSERFKEVIFFKARVPEVQTCLFCCSLRTGSLIIATVSMMLCTIYCAALLTLLTHSTMPIIMTEEDIAYENFQFLLLHAGMLFAVCALLEVFSIFLFIGIKQYKETYVLSWVIAVTAINIFQMLMFSFYFTLMQRPLDYTTDVFPIFDICVCFYVALIVYSYYREITRMKNKPQTFSNEA